MIMENYPKLGSGSKYYEKLVEYVTEAGLEFDFKNEISIKKFEELIGESIVKMADCHFADREHIPLKYNKNGSVSKKQKVVIDGTDFEDDLVIYSGVHENWNDDSDEWLYCIAFDKHIVKIGMTITDLKTRYASYACGDRKAMHKGSCSTTNYVINEINYAALLLGHTVEIFGIRVPKEKKEITRFGITRIVDVSVVRGMEEMLTDVFVEYAGHIPVLCVQKGDSTS
jgi:hypothetical protein